MSQSKEKPYDHYDKTQAPLREDKESQPQKCPRITAYGQCGVKGCPYCGKHTFLNQQSWEEEFDAIDGTDFEPDFVREFVRQKKQEWEQAARQEERDRVVEIVNDFMVKTPTGMPEVYEMLLDVKQAIKIKES